MGSGSVAAVSVFPRAASLATRTGDRQEQSGAVRQTCGACRIGSEELHMEVGDLGDVVAYCRPAGMLQAQRRPDASRCAKHDRAGPHATPWDLTAFP